MKILFFISSIILCILAGVMLNGCHKDGNGTSNTPLPFSVPAGFPQPNYTFEGNPLTQQGFDLGRKLFYDGQLSIDGNFPCASCHQQFAAFSTYDHDLSHGFNNQFTTRNAPGLFNLVWLKEFHLDGAINHIEVQPLAPITATNEMADDINNVIRKLKNDNTYPPLFSAAFGSGEINSQRILKALTQFMASMVSANAKYDKVKRNAASFTSIEQAGYTLFQGKCAVCHQEPLFTDLSYRNTGLSLNPFLKDLGRMHITGNRQDSLKFRVPSLRNVMLTFPYSHDGRLYTIDQVLDHYATGILQSSTLDPLLKNGIKLTASERSNIKAFLSTLTDSSFISDKRFAQPE